MRYLYIAFLFLVGCTSNSQHTKSEFITVDYLYCVPLNKIYSKKQLSKIDSFHLKSSECGIVYESVRIKKSIIIAFAPNYSIVLTKINEHSDDPSSPLKVDRVNVEHCAVRFSTNETKFIGMKCDELEEKLQ